MYAVKHVNLIDTHIPPKKNANQARIVETVAEFTVSSVDRNAFFEYSKSFGNT
jgi:hypothetical protein